ncbi:fumarylacetoacetate hydrolase family protein [Candidatus Omnitrophota bacterium]
MKIARFSHNSKINYGIIEGKSIKIVNGSIFDNNIDLSDLPIPMSSVKLLAPVIPSKIICVGLNYKDHAKELDMPLPKEPIIFLKPPTTLLGPDETIVYPPAIGRLDYEAELAIVIKKETKSVSAIDAKRHILGYTCLNDVTARDLQKKDGQWTRSKSFDTFCPVGPHIETDLSLADLQIEALVNGEVRQLSRTSELIFGVDLLIEFISAIMTLYPGDIIATGTPKGVGPMKSGDLVSIRIEAIGSLSNYVK